MAGYTALRQVEVTLAAVLDRLEYITRTVHATRLLRWLWAKVADMAKLGWYTVA